ncbi:adenylyl-sulfate kinase [Robbsia andropogonis]|uniref:adenylyl-sulfate kinase n=1 Tax=Robbsia andropogonis TaxID=28092 RepID=UPI003D26315A
MAKIIGITGLAGAGKDSFARELQLALVASGKEARIDSFADPIRRISQLMGLEPYGRDAKERRITLTADAFRDRLYAAIEVVLHDRLEGHKRAELYAYTVEACEKFEYGGNPKARPPTHGREMDISPREFMQILGTEGGQRVSKTLWVNMASMLWRAFPGFVLVTDVRFTHEAAMADCLFVVVRPGVVRVNGHKSEELADKLTQGLRPAFIKRETLFYVDNDRSLEALANKACHLANAFF